MALKLSDLQERWDAVVGHSPVVRFIDINLRGAGQVMFMNNPLTGLLILIAIFVGAIDASMTQVAIGAVVGLVIGTATAIVLGVDDASLKQGLFGFSPLLTGAAIPTFVANKPMTWVYLDIGAAVTTVVTLAIGNIFKTWGVPALTFPFVLTTWFLLLGAYQLYRIHNRSLGPAGLPAFATAATAHVDMSASYVVTSMLRGVSQVFLIGNWVSGIIILIALAVNSRWASALAAAGTIVATLLALAFGANGSSINAGLYGFSAVLTAVALGCVFYQPSAGVLLYALIGTVFTLFVQAALNTALAPVGIPTLTAPFVLVTWLFLLPKRDFTPTPHHERTSGGVMSHSPDASA